VSSSITIPVFFWKFSWRITAVSSFAAVFHICFFLLDYSPSVYDFSPFSDGEKSSKSLYFPKSLVWDIFWSTRVAYLLCSNRCQPNSVQFWHVNKNVSPQTILQPIRVDQLNDGDRVGQNKGRMWNHLEKLQYLKYDIMDIDTDYYPLQLRFDLPRRIFRSLPTC